MQDIIIQFARLWGQREVLILNEKDERMADMLKSYDSEDLQQLLQLWADEFTNGSEDDTVDFFERKLDELYNVCYEQGCELFGTSETVKIWLEELGDPTIEELENEIDEVSCAIRNEKMWALGTPENNDHERNVEELTEYFTILNEMLEDKTH